MLRKIGDSLPLENISMDGARTTFGEAAFPAPFSEGLEYSSPARGVWNIAHTGFLIPEAHEIFVCARGCLRGVVLTAAEANALSRYSAVEIREENVLDGSMEDLMIEGITDVLRKLPYRPRAVLLYISCQHFLLAYDQQYVYAELRVRFPDIRFADCYMIPTLRKSGLSPDQRMRVQLYSMLEPREKDPKKLNLIGSNLAVDPSAEFLPWLSANGFSLTSIQSCRTFDDYLAMAEASRNLYYEPVAAMAAKELEDRLGQEPFYLPFVFDREGLEKGYRKLADCLGIPPLEVSGPAEAAEAALARAKAHIKDTPIAVDYTFTFRPLNFVRLLLSHGFRVTEVFEDSFLPEEKEDFLWIREHFPETILWASTRPKMRVAPRERTEKILAIGQKAAYFTGSEHFVNVAESGGLYGFAGICRIASLMEEAFDEKKDPRGLIQRKAWGCASCI